MTGTGPPPRPTTHTVRYRRVAGRGRGPARFQSDEKCSRLIDGAATARFVRLSVPLGPTQYSSGTVPAGAVVSVHGAHLHKQATEVVSTADTMPTALWLLGLEIPAGLAGVRQFSVRESNAAEAQDSGQAPRPLGPPCVILVIPALLILAVFLRPMRTR